MVTASGQDNNANFEKPSVGSPPISTWNLDKEDNKEKSLGAVPNSAL